MPANSFISGLLGGFSQSTADYRKAAQDEADKKFAAENKVLEMLAASDDIDLSTAAIAGLTDMNTPRKKGFLDNLIGGNYQPNPALAHIHALIQAGKQIPGTPGTPGPTVGGVNLPVGPPTISPPPTAAAQQAPSGVSAAMPATSGAQAPPPAAALPSPAPGPPPNALPAARTQMAGQPGTPARVEPRTIFKSPEQRMRDTTLAKSTADVEGEIAGMVAGGFTPDEARAIYRAKAQRLAGTAAPYQSIPGTMPDGTPAFGVFNRQTGQYHDGETGAPMPGFRPRTTGAQATHYRLALVKPGLPSGTPAAQALATSGQGIPGWIVTDPTTGTELTGGYGPNPDFMAVGQEGDAAGNIRSKLYVEPRSTTLPGTPGTISPPPAATPPAPGRSGAAINQLPTQPPFAPAGAQAGAAKSPDVYPGAPPAAPSPVTQQPGGGRVIDLGPKSPAGQSNITIALPGGDVVTAQENKVTGAVTVNGTPVPAGWKKVPESAAMPTAQERNLLGAIQTARPMMAQVEQLLQGRAGDNSLLTKGTAILNNAQYRTGFAPSDAFYKAWLPLVNLMDVYITKGYLGGVRNQKWIDLIMQHTPKSTDTPMLAKEKLDNIKLAFDGIENELVGSAVQPKGGSASQLQPNATHEVTQNGKRFTVTTDAQGNVISAVEIR